MSATAGPVARWARRPRASRWLAVAVLLLLAWACSGGGSRPLELTPWSPPGGQSCNTRPPSLALDAAVDTAGLASRVAELGLPDGGILLTLSGEGGGPVELRRLETTFPADAAVAAESAVVQARRADAGSGSARLLLRVSGGAVSELAIGSTEHCRPVIRNGIELSRMLQRLHEELGLEATATVWISVDTAGRTGGVRVVRSSGYQELDVALHRVARQVTLFPALSERRAVPVWVSLDLTIEERCGPPSDTAAFPLLDNPCFGTSRP